MRTTNWIATLAAGSIALLGACAPEPAPAPQVVYAQPTFDKLGNPSCRPGNVPVGGAYSADLPLCGIISGAPPAADVVSRNDADGETR